MQIKGSNLKKTKFQMLKILQNYRKNTYTSEIIKL